MRIRKLAAHAALITFVAAAQLRGQKVIDLTGDQLDRFLKGADQEQVELGQNGDQLRELDDKIKKFRDCRKAFEIAQGITDGKLNLSARLLMRAKCGASDEDGFQNDRKKITDGPMTNGAKTAGMKPVEYSNLKDRIMDYMHGDRNGFTQRGLDLLKSRESDLSKTFGMPVQQPGAGGGAGMAGMGGGRMAGGAWTADYTWIYLQTVMYMQYGSGAAAFEQPYKPGEWTRWKITAGGSDNDLQSIERAFLATTDDKSEWWRMSMTTKDGNKLDTLIIEALYKPTSEYTRELVRVRGKLPGSADPQELMVPANMGMVNYNGMLGSRPTKESVDGATVGTESVKTDAGSFSAKHVRYGGAGGGTLNWWLTPDVPGGWVKFTGGAGGGDAKDTYTMEMVAKGTGAKSVLGVIK